MYKVFHSFSKEMRMVNMYLEYLIENADLNE